MAHASLASKSSFQTPSSGQSEPPSSPPALFQLPCMSCSPIRGRETDPLHLSIQNSVQLASPSFPHLLKGKRDGDTTKFVVFSPPPSSRERGSESKRGARMIRGLAQRGGNYPKRGDTRRDGGRGGRQCRYKGHLRTRALSHGE